MKYVYPAVIRPDGKSYHVFFPDIEGAGTCGDDYQDCIEMGEDWLCLVLYNIEQEGRPIPEPSDINEVCIEEGDIKTLIHVDTEFYQRFYEQKAVRKTLSIPA